MLASFAFMAGHRGYEMVITEGREQMKLTWVTDRMLCLVSVICGKYCFSPRTVHSLLGQMFFSQEMCNLSMGSLNGEHLLGNFSVLLFSGTGIFGI